MWFSHGGAAQCGVAAGGEVDGVRQQYAVVVGGFLRAVSAAIETGVDAGTSCCAVYGHLRSDMAVDCCL